ncbi:hypothetical protein A9Q87_01035 [Flavobacteriales bacterium 34_180_T64]|nr:hypothetical protein A9Q87_01035 [Flavobacteriales bacterium 34_180_T64]
MKNIILLISLFTILGCARKQDSSEINAFYFYKLDLTKSIEDKLLVELEYTGKLTDTISFCLPKIVPGIYNSTNFGKFVNDFKAFDTKGNALKTIKKDQNCWTIINASSLSQISYKIDDGWEEFDFTDLRPYRSAESSYSNNAYIISTPAVFGYFKNHKDETIKIEIEKPSEFYGATGLSLTSSSKTTDYFQTNKYSQLVDNPILYSSPDTTKIKLPNINIEVACYSSSGKKLSKKIAEYIKPLLENQTKYLGGKLPVDKYTFIIYHNLNPSETSYYSEGLEHASSTLVLMYIPDNIETIKNTIYRTASHEFFHTIMPIGLHSEEISNYNFNEPKFSKHLWLYEGMTEYFTIHMPIKHKLQTLDNFINTLENKVIEMKKLDPDLPFSELSKNPIKHQNQYMNVYFKGPLLNLCLDIKLRELSNGKYGVQEMIQDLIKEYGPNHPFKDDKLFSEIVRVTGYNELNEFFEKYIENSNTIPLIFELKKVGLNLDWESGKITIEKELTLKQINLRKHWINQ